eukprot:CAMPEP_0197029840 /NCGR_PEP_ID=MMETSP1384-20130603/9205_1 /TAXON_ID=29189 /ORGANISM="Ammonia sp." /LENGTH=153 /DNA_ID=CAMNT_0042459079 /DNA_START=26 /DNA_END=487 /DNA_ORIENTATION=-
MLRSTNRLLYTSRVLGVGAKPNLTKSTPVIHHTATRSHSLFWQRMGIDFARMKLRLNPLSLQEGGGRWWYYAAFEWYFVGTFVWATIPWFFYVQYAGHWIRSWEFHNLKLQDDTYRDPLIPPPDVWYRQNRDFLEELKIRQERFEQQKERLAD